MAEGGDSCVRAVRVGFNLYFCDTDDFPGAWQMGNPILASVAKILGLHFSGDVFLFLPV